MPTAAQAPAPAAQPQPPQRDLMGEPGSSMQSSADPRLSQYKVIRRNGAVVAFEPGKISVAMTKELKAGRVLEKRYFGREWVLWRDSAGAPVAAGGPPPHASGRWLVMPPPTVPGGSPSLGRAVLC